MIRNNSVCEVLATSGNQGLATINTSLLSLNPGQVGLFDAKTNQAVDPRGGALTPHMYFAMGVDSTGDGNTDDILKSAGSFFQLKNLRYTSYKPYVPSAPMIFTLTNYTANCNTDYGLKIEFRNQEIYRTQGYNQFTKSYVVKTGYCKDCNTGCPSGDANEITRDLIIEINNDKDKLISAVGTARTALTAATHGITADLAPGADLADGDLEAILAFNAAQADSSTYVYTDLKVTTSPTAVNDFASVALKYYNPRQTVVIPAKIGELTHQGKLTTIQEASYEEGAGYDVKQLEYYAKGFKESAYRTSSIYGVADEKKFNAVTGVNYNIFVIAYEQSSNGGWEKYLNSQETIIAVPTTATATDIALKTLFNALDRNAEESV